MLKALKSFTLLSWLLLTSCFFIENPWAEYGRYFFFGLALVHFTEFFIFHTILTKKSDSFPLRLINTLLFGVFYIKEELFK